MKLRPEAASDRTAIRRVHEAAFPSAAEADIVDTLRDAGDLTISIVAIIDDEIVGHVAFSPVTLNDVDFGLGLAPVAVLPAHQQSGIGSVLIQRGLDECRNRETDWVVVLGDPAYYSRFGFEPASQWGLRDEYGGGDAFQAQILGGNPTSVVDGLVKYASAFAVAG